MLSAHLNRKISELIPQDASFAIAFSGGGDSTALVHALKDHSQAGRVFIVDHDLRQGSTAEAQAAQTFALACGYDAKVLKWRHDSPKTALQEKARKARYALMGHECRNAGIQYLLTAHSEDDQAETLMMRYDRNTDWRGAAGMAEVTYGPVWPELALVNIVRPLLGVSRQALRDYNLEQGLEWAEDPSNQNRNYARIRARDFFQNFAEVKDDLLNTAREMQSALADEKKILGEQFDFIGKVNPNGYITLSDVPLPELMLLMLRAVGGQNGLIDRAKIKRLLSSMRGAAFKSATLGGSLVAKDQNGFIICRDPVAVKGRRDNPKAHHELQKHLRMCLEREHQIWDGRFKVWGGEGLSYMGALHHHTDELSKAQKEELKKIPACVRPTLPIIRSETGVLQMGHHNDDAQFGVVSLIRPRLEAALGGKLS